MTILSWIMSKLENRKNQERFWQAIHAADDVATTARELRRQIEPLAKLEIVDSNLSRAAPISTVQRISPIVADFRRVNS